MPTEKIKPILKRKYIYLDPTPQKDIPKGLWAKLENLNKQYNTDLIYTDIIKGQKKYSLPRNVKVIKVWVKNLHTQLCQKN